jgi:hypothetical protein
MIFKMDELTLVEFEFAAKLPQALIGENDGSLDLITVQPKGVAA